MMSHKDIVAAINALAPGAAWSLEGETLDGLRWQDESPRPSNDAIMAEAGRIGGLPPPYSVSKFEFIDRMTDAEAALFEAALAASPAKERLAFQNAASLNSTNPMFAVFAGRVAALFDETRAAELLAAEASP